MNGILKILDSFSLIEDESQIYILQSIYSGKRHPEIALGLLRLHASFFLIHSTSQEHSEEEEEEEEVHS